MSRKVSVCIVSLIILCFLCFSNTFQPSDLWAAFITDDFDSYNDGNLNAVPNWGGVADADFYVQGTITKSGAKAVENSTAASIPTDQIGRTFGVATDGSQRIWMRANDNSKAVGLMQILEATTGLNIAQIWLSNDGKVYYAHLGGTVELGSYSSNTWYPFDIEIRSSDYKIRYRFNNGSWTN